LHNEELLVVLHGGRLFDHFVVLQDHQFNNQVLGHALGETFTQYLNLLFNTRLNQFVADVFLPIKELLFNYFSSLLKDFVVLNVAKNSLLRCLLAFQVVDIFHLIICRNKAELGKLIKKICDWQNWQSNAFNMNTVLLCVSNHITLTTQ